MHLIDVIPTCQHDDKRGACARRIVLEQQGRRQAWAALRDPAVVGGSALLVGLAAGASGWAWAGWFALAPLLLIVARSAPMRGALIGAWWGLIAGLGAAIVGETGSILTALAPAGVVALFGGTAAFISKRLGVRPLLIALLWIGVELSLSAAGWQRGLLAATQSNDTPIGWLNSIFGWAIVAFLIAWFNAQLVVAIDSMVRLARRAPSLNAEAPPRIRLPIEPLLEPVSVIALHQGGPRAPPRCGRCSI